MTDEIDDQLIIRNITAVVSDFLSENLPNNEPDIYLKPHLPERVKAQILSPLDLTRSDLYCNLRVLIGNHRFLRDVGILSGSTVNECARIVLAYRNRLAHQNRGEIISIEHSQLEYIAVNRLISLLPTRTNLQELVEETRAIVGSALVFLAKEYFNSELKTNKRIEILLKSGSDQNTFEEDYAEVVESRTEVRVSISECKQLLRRLREQVQQEFEDTPNWRNILRESILDNIVEGKVHGEQSFKAAVSRGQFDKTDPRQFIYFDRIAEITARL